MSAPLFRIDDIRLAERDVALRLPFRFGSATVRSCPQAFAQVRIRFGDGATATGHAAEMMIPKWFDKRPALSQDDNVRQLRDALAMARDAYRSDSAPSTAWGHFARWYTDLQSAAAKRDLPALVASYGPALLDRAILDALCHHLKLSFGQAMTANIPGMNPADSGLVSDLRDFDFNAFLAAHDASSMDRKIAARHTVGLADALTGAPAGLPEDGLPVTLAQAVARYGHDYFKIKLSGDTAADLRRLADITAVISQNMRLVSLDGNEQFEDQAHLAQFTEALERHPDLGPLRAHLAYIEQPLPRSSTLTSDLSARKQPYALLIDESDATLDSFLEARPLGYTGVSSKSCKGFYKSVINAARCAHWPVSDGRPYFLSAEDLTMQAGIGVQQDLALVGWLGLEHVERNGHHYVNGLAGTPDTEQNQFLSQFPALYERSNGAVRLHIAQGRIDLSDLDCPGFATGTDEPITWSTLRSTH
ncbi:MAG: hypothetical protein EPN31_09350 [Castellaniella sp.]|uniref:enolase C-terminal domain-like protein n=1 Tax=Castellaniella sp. TaxID=1955812 RepID=UPI0011FA3D7B|nr:enolase C-terminal domain-like protein [Castellaniella sp.]TAN28069.1 MAG: hypothetical protein EPN31_09350 [Castellaniella sp.]